MTPKDKQIKVLLVLERIRYLHIQICEAYKDLAKVRGISDQAQVSEVNKAIENMEYAIESIGSRIQQQINQIKR